MIHIKGDKMSEIICGDCLTVLRDYPNKSFNLIIVDPPYNIGIDRWDRIENYYDWLLERFTEFERVLKDNGTLWLFHISFPMLSNIHQRLEKETNFRFKQFITINKGIQSIAGRTSEHLRSYPRATEYLVFYQQINPMAKYLKEELGQANVTCIEVAEAGHFYGKVNHGGSVSNWLSGSNIPSKAQYEKMRDYFKGEYLKREYEDLIYIFNLEYGVTDVWHIDFYKDRVPWHSTSKPLKLIERIIETSTKEGDIVLDPFLGSGTTALVCKQLNRGCIGIEINPEYVKKAKTRKVQSLR